MSCLFNSLNYFIKEGSTEIRNKICDYLQNNSPIIDGLETQTILNMESQTYIQDMRRTSTWGGAIEIQAACNIWNLRIIVRNHRCHKHTEIEFLPIHSRDIITDNTIEIEWTGGHYEPVRT